MRLSSDSPLRGILHRLCFRRGGTFHMLQSTVESCKRMPACEMLGPSLAQPHLRHVQLTAACAFAWRNARCRSAGVFCPLTCTHDVPRLVPRSYPLCKVRRRSHHAPLEPIQRRRVRDAEERAAGGEEPSAHKLLVRRGMSRRNPR
jgi:hypothetical protein